MFLNLFLFTVSSTELPAFEHRKLWCLHGERSSPIGLLVCVMNFTFIQSYYIRRSFTIGHVCPVPVDKHDSDTNFTPTTPDPLDWIKDQIFEFCNKWKSFINILLKIVMQTEVQ